MTQLLLKPFLDSVSRKTIKPKVIEAMFNSPAIQWTEAEELFREQLVRFILSNFVNAGWGLQTGKDLLEEVTDPKASVQEISTKISERFSSAAMGNIPVEILAKIFHRDPLSYSDIAAMGQALSVILETHFYRVTYANESESREFAESSAAKDRYAYSDFGQLFQIMNQFPMTATATNLDRTQWPVYKFSLRLPDAEMVVNR